MIWLTSRDETAPGLPAAWLIATGGRPANLTERAALRRGVARDLVARQLALPPQAVTIGHDARGRPVLARPAGAGLAISLATRSGLVAVALARGPVGIDVEQVDPASEPPLAILHPDERAALLALPATARPLAFARLWAVKEAYVKALGTGFARAPESFAALPRGTGGFVIADPQRAAAARVAVRMHANGSQTILAAAAVLLDP